MFCFSPASFRIVLLSAAVGAFAHAAAGPRSEVKFPQRDLSKMQSEGQLPFKNVKLKRTKDVAGFKN